MLDPDKVEHYASRGMTLQQIADMFNVALSTLMLRKAEYTDISEAFQRGRAKGVEKFTNLLLDQAEAGSTGATIFYLKARASWSENQAQLDIMQKQIDELKAVIAGSESD